VLDPTGDLSHRIPSSPDTDAAHGKHAGLKVTAVSKKNYIEKSSVVDKYRRMAGYVEISCKKGAVKQTYRGENLWNEI